MKRKKGNADRLTAGAWWSRNRWSCVILAAALVLFIVVRMAAVTFEQPQPRGDEYAEYETGVVTDILSDNTEADAVADGGYRGEQLLLAQVRSGQYKGETMQVYNYVGPLYGQPLKVGQRAVLLISTYSDGSHTATVYEYDRAVGLAVTVGLFLLATVLVGGKVGSQVSGGAGCDAGVPVLDPDPPADEGSVHAADGVSGVRLHHRGDDGDLGRRVPQDGVCCAGYGGRYGAGAAVRPAVPELSADRRPAADGCGTAAAAAADGYASGPAGPAGGGGSHQCAGRRDGRGHEHLLCADGGTYRGPDRRLARLARYEWPGRDMVGTMTNTLILAFLGSGLSFIIYLYSLGLDPWQLINSPSGRRVISGIASSIGVILAVPLTALITSFILVKDKKPKAPCGSKPEDKKLPKEVQ